jgi:hypothetical protein
MRQWWSFALTLGLLGLAGAANALSFTLDDIPTGPITSGNGQLQFSNIQFFSPFNTVAASQITLTVLDDGVKLSGPVGVSDNDFKSFSVLYQVTALGAGINGASQLLDSNVDADHFGLVLATKDILGNKQNQKGMWGQEDGGGHDWWKPGWGGDGWSGGPFDQKTLARLKTYDLEVARRWCGGFGPNRDEAVRLVEAGFSPQTMIRVVDRVSLSVGDGTATWTSSTNRFTVVPEPATGALTLLGLGALGRRMRRKPA